MSTPIEDSRIRLRAYIRHPASVPIELVPQDASGTTTSHELKNVSPGGLCCKSGSYLEAGVQVKVRVPFVMPVFESVGQIAWCKKQENDFEVGVRFVEPNSSFRMRMVEQICHIEQYRKDVREREGRDLSGGEAAVEWIRKYADGFPDPLRIEGLRD